MASPSGGGNELAVGVAGEGKGGDCERGGSFTGSASVLVSFSSWLVTKGAEGGLLSSPTPQSPSAFLSGCGEP